MITTGRCQCAAVAWRLDGAVTFISHCHCSICRRIHGAAFGSFAHGPASDFHWVRGETSIARYESSPGIFRAFCRNCGSQVPVIERDQVCIPAGGIDGDPGARPSRHIFVGSKAPWYEIADSLPQHEEFPPDAVT
jgi:hypothetical protein